MVLGFGSKKNKTMLGEKFTFMIKSYDNYSTEGMAFAVMEEFILCLIICIIASITNNQSICISFMVRVFYCLCITFDCTPRTIFCNKKIHTCCYYKYYMFTYKYLVHKEKPCHIKLRIAYDNFILSDWDSYCNIQFEVCTVIDW